MPYLPARKSSRAVCCASGGEIRCVWTASLNQVSISTASGLLTETLPSGPTSVPPAWSTIGRWYHGMSSQVPKPHWSTWPSPFVSRVMAVAAATTSSQVCGGAAGSRPACSIIVALNHNPGVLLWNGIAQRPSRYVYRLHKPSWMSAMASSVRYSSAGITTPASTICGIP